MRPHQMFAAICVLFAGCSADTVDDKPLQIDTEDSGNATNVVVQDMGMRPDDIGNLPDAAQADMSVDDDIGAPDMVDPPILAPEVDPNCVDGQYRETPPDPSADITAFVAAYSEPAAKQFYDDVLEARYPVGAHLVRLGAVDPNFDCVEVFGFDLSTAERAISSISTVVHECGHFADLDLADDSYIITPSLTLTCVDGDTTERFGDTFARSRIRNDQFQPLHPQCPPGQFSGCDSYLDVYLDGDPDDAEFDGGDQGFNSLLEETTQYVNSLATDYAFAEYIGGGVSARDGILTFLWYLQRYLRMARLDYPGAYARIAEDPCWRNAILTVWGRAWMMLELSEGNSALGIDDTRLFELVREPELLQEIQRLRDLEGC